MDATVSNLLTFLGGSVQLVVPVYQRPYSWDKKHCEQLWEDIMKVGRSDREVGHFLGSIVHVSDVHSFSGLSKMLLIDGQQRITTITLLLLAMKEVLGDREIGDQEISAYLDNPCCTGESKYKLLLSKGDRDTLLYLLDGSNPKPQNVCKKLIENLSWLSQWLKEADAKNELEIVWRGLGRLRVVEISLDRDKDNPQLIFESMNSTGKDLSQADLIRNYVLMGMEPNIQTKLYEKYWYPMEVNFGDKYDEHFDAFVRNFLSMEIRELPKIDDVYEKFKLYGSECDDVEEILRSLLRYSKFYCNMALNREEDPGLKAAFLEFNSNLKADVTMPFLLKVYDHYDRGALDRSSFEKIVRLVISYIFRRLICNLPSNRLRGIFIDLVGDIQEGISLDLMETHFRGLLGLGRFPDDLEFFGHLTTRDIYGLSCRLYILETLENHKRKEKIPHKQYTIEHIMPKELDEVWEEELGSDHEEIHRKYLHTLGNLTLTGYNSEYGNKPFKAKRDMRGGFGSSPLNLNKDLGDYDVWNEATIQERAENLANEACRIWRAPGTIGEKFHNTSMSYSVDHHFAHRDDRPLYDAFKNEVSKLGEVREEAKKICIAFYIGKIRILEVIPYADYLKISFKANVSSINDPESKIEEVGDRGRGFGNAAVKLRFINEIPYLMGLMKQVLKQGA